MHYYLAVWSLLLGLVIGSFLNVVIYRLPRRESLSRPGSHCPTCDTAIRWYDNLPVLSWVLLRARCRFCRSPISGRYPLVEGITGAGFLAAFLAIGISPAVLLAWAFIAVVVTLAFIESDLGVVPDRLLLPAVVVGLGASITLDPGHWWYYLVGCLGAGALALAPAMVSPRWGRLSEAKIALLVGSVFGLWTLAAVPAALFLRSVAGIAPVFWQKGRLRARTVFSPCPADLDMRQQVEAVDRVEAKVDAEVMTWL